MSDDGMSVSRSPVHCNCCRAALCCPLLPAAAGQSALSWGKNGGWGGERCVTSYLCCPLLPLLPENRGSRAADNANWRTAAIPFVNYSSYNIFNLNSINAEE